MYDSERDEFHAALGSSSQQQPFSHLTGMTKTCSRVLVCALAFSLVIHLLFAAVIRPIGSVEAATEQRPVPLHIIVIHTPPPPAPTPKPSRAPKTESLQRAQTQLPRRVVPHVPFRNDRGHSDPLPKGIVALGTPGPVGAEPSASPGTPEATPTPKPACSFPNAPAATVNVVSPSIPDELGADVNAEAQVRVTLQPTGAVDGVAIYRSAGNALLDHEALRAARQSTYRAEIRDCSPVRGDYLFTVDFKE